MILLNFSHPLTDAQREQIEALTGDAITESRDIPAQFDNLLVHLGVNNYAESALPW